MKKAYLILDDGTVFAGNSFGAEHETSGELVFTTEMNCYLETIVNPKYKGKFVLQTFPLIGNYGIVEAELNNQKPTLSGYIIKHLCETPSNWQSTGTLGAFLKQHEIPGICNIDTRKLTKIIRVRGHVTAKITYKQ